MSGHHSPTPWKVEPMSPAFAQIVDADGGVVVEKMFKDDAAFIVRCVNAWHTANHPTEPLTEPWMPERGNGDGRD